MEDTFIILIMTKYGLQTGTDDDGYTLSFESEERARAYARDYEQDAYVVAVNASKHEVEK